MGRFTFHPYQCPDLESLMALAYLDSPLGCGSDMRAVVADDRIEIVREDESTDSAYLHMPWDVKGIGRVTLSTATLMMREQPYILPVELARGMLGRLRLQYAQWTEAGLDIPESIQVLLAEAMQHFRHAVTTPPSDEQQIDEAAESAQKAIRLAAQLDLKLAQTYTLQAMEVRRRLTERLNSLVAVRMSEIPPEEDRPLIERACNAITIPIDWRTIEPAETEYDWTELQARFRWAQETGKMIVAGPLVRLDRWLMPDWLEPWLDSPEAIGAAVGEFVGELVHRFRGIPVMWNLCESFNAITGALALSLQDRASILAEIADAVRRNDPSAKRLLTIDQPFKEYVATPSCRAVPVYLADALMKSELELDGVILQMDVGFAGDQGTHLRLPAEISEMLDDWSELEVPIFVSLTLPSDTFEDPLSDRKPTIIPPDASPETQAQWLERYLPLLMVKACVKGVFIGGWRDEMPHDHPHTGLIDFGGDQKPALKVLTDFRESTTI